MAKVLSSITFDAPAAPVEAAPSDTFAFSGTPSFAGSGGVQRYDFKWEVNDGGGFVTVGASGTGLITAGTNPLVNTNSQTQNSITVTCDQVGTYTIRMVGAPTSGGSYTVLSSEQTVTVAAAATNFQGTGALAVQSAAVAGAAGVGRTATGALSAQSAAAAGTAVVGRATTGALAAQAATIAGAAVAKRVSTGTLAAQTAAIAGDATVASGAENLQATGTLTVQSAAIAGAAVVKRAANGALPAQDAGIAGTVVVGRAATGALQSGSMTVSGSAVVRRTATGYLVAPSASIAGSAAYSGGAEVPAGSASLSPATFALLIPREHVPPRRLAGRGASRLKSDVRADREFGTMARVAELQDYLDDVEQWIAEQGISSEQYADVFAAENLDTDDDLFGRRQWRRNR